MHENIPNRDFLKKDLVRITQTTITQTHVQRGKYQFQSSLEMKNYMEYKHFQMLITTTLEQRKYPSKYHRI